MVVLLKHLILRSRSIKPLRCARLRDNFSYPMIAQLMRRLSLSWLKMLWLHYKILEARDPGRRVLGQERYKCTPEALTDELMIVDVGSTSKSFDW